MLGAIPMVSGVVAIFLMKESPNVIKNTNPDFLKYCEYEIPFVMPNLIQQIKLVFLFRVYDIKHMRQIYQQPLIYQNVGKHLINLDAAYYLTHQPKIALFACDV